MCVFCLTKGVFSDFRTYFILISFLCYTLEVFPKYLKNTSHFKLKIEPTDIIKKKKKKKMKGLVVRIKVRE